ncbi:MAG TPA: trehalose-6-phosphate synthase [Acidobacteriota bacterium]|nr:trehalose-6-phosphate synthase [Acidobacteriota bacterium]
MRILTASNRLPFWIGKNEAGFNLIEASEGIAASINTFLQKSSIDYLWFGKPNIDLSQDSEEINEFLLEKKIIPVTLEPGLFEFSERFCNKTIWPLFHYFPSQASYDSKHWRAYVQINEKFSSSIQPRLQEGDLIWIQDYHLLLLPHLIRQMAPMGCKIGVFLNIPFPSYEVFRQIPLAWAKKIISGLLACDLIGFQTEGFVQSFVRCVSSFLSLPSEDKKILLGNRVVHVEAFPVGIDFEKYHNSSLQPEVSLEVENMKKSFLQRKIILSIDRLDHSKGILNKLISYEKFLETNTTWHQRVTYLCVVAPSRIKDEHYLSIKRRIDEIVGRINGRFGSFNWIPIVYQHQFLPFQKLAALYNSGDVMLITPLREGMNLIAKEYVATRRSNTGVLILSELAGASKELKDALIVNPNDVDAIVSAIQQALSLSGNEQKRRIESMQSSIKNHDLFRWANSFLQILSSIKSVCSFFTLIPELLPFVT